MKKQTKIRSIIAALTLTVMIPFAALPTKAMTVPKTYWPGSQASGATVINESGVVLEKQSIRFNISDFPAFNDEEKIDEYQGTVETEYTFFNPTDSEVILKLIYPIGRAPDYLTKIDPAKYSVSLNGEAVDTALRHSFNSENFYESISDEYMSNDICSTDMPVTKYIFKQSGVKKSYAGIGFDVKKNELVGSCIYFGSNGNQWEQADGDIRINTIAGENGDTYTLYVFGNDLPRLPDWKIYENAAVSDGDEIEGKIELVGKETLTLLDFATEKYDEELGINHVDWFNIIGTELSLTMERGNVTINFSSLNSYINNYLVSGYVYEITIQPGERVINKLRAPAYPSVNGQYEPKIYTYQYLLTAKNVVSIGNIDVTVNTPYYLKNHTSAFEKADGGYHFSIDPQSFTPDYEGRVTVEILFDLCEEENPQIVKNKLSVWGWILLIIAIPLLLVAGLFYLIVNLFNLIVNGIEFVINKIK